jgi:hypothetical protein
MSSRLPLKPFAALPLALMAVALAGCPDTSETGAGGSSPGGKLTLVQTLVASDDPEITLTRDFVLSPDDKELYAATWNGEILTFDRSPTDGSLTRKYATALSNAFGIVVTPDGRSLYGVGANTAGLIHFDVDAVTGKPVPQSTLFVVGGFELSLAADASWLFQSSGGVATSTIRSYQIHAFNGVLTPGAITPHDSPDSNFALLADDEHNTLFAEKVTGGVKSIVRYIVDTDTGALIKEAEAVADLWWGYTILAICKGTTRMYVPQEAGNIGYADISGNGLSIPSSFTHPDLAHVRSVTLSADCKNAYAVTQQGANGSLVVLARDDAGDLSWIETIPMGQGTSIFAITEPWYARLSADGKNVYVSSWASGEGFAVFHRDPTGALH